MGKIPFTGKKPPDVPPKPPEFLEDRLKAKRDTLVVARDQAQRELAGLQNQLYVLDELLNPQPEETPGETPPNGNDPGQGRI